MWTIDSIPDQSGRVAIVTGANSGIGFETARVLAARGATVVLACRSAEKAARALSQIRDAAPSADVTFLPLDLADLASVHSFVERFTALHSRLDLLINNAGIMMVEHGKTADGFERQLGTNHLGHFALTGLLVAILAKTSGSRVVTVSSLAHLGGDIHFDDLTGDKRYGKIKQYNQSKLANLLFMAELQRRLDAAGVKTVSVAAHPGWTATNLQHTVPLFDKLNPFLAMKPLQGAQPTLYAATADDVAGGEYFGPTGAFEVWGGPGRAKRSKRARSPQLAARLWQVSEELTGVTFAV